MKINVYPLVFVILISLAFTVSMASAGNLTDDASLTNPSPNSTVLPGEPYITIDPIGNHTIGDVFFINGTTNLPVSEDLSVIIRSTRHISRPHMKTEITHGFDSGYVPIIKGINGTNLWSVNATDGTWGEDAYFASVESSKEVPCYNHVQGCMEPEVRKTQVFYMFYPESMIFATNTTPPPVNHLTSVPSSLVQSPISTVPQPSPTNRATPFPVILLIIVLAGIVTLRSFKREKRE